MDKPVIEETILVPVPKPDKNKIRMVISLCITAGMSNASFSLMAPFYPLVARKK
jgi:hypothetical protein